MMGADVILARLRAHLGAMTNADIYTTNQAAADLIESQQRMIEFLSGTGQKIPTHDELMAVLRRVAQLAHRYFEDQDLGDEREWASNLYDIIRTAPREARE